MAAPKRTKTQRESDFLLISGLLLRGLHASQIAKNLNSLPNRPYKLSRQQIDYDTRAIKKLWLEKSANSYDVHVSNELARLNFLEQTYWQKWEDSITNPPKMIETRGKIITEKQGGETVRKAPTSIDRTEKKVENALGEIAFLQGVERCIKMRINLLGLGRGDEKGGDTNVYQKIYMLPEKAPLKTIESIE